MTSQAIKDALATTDGKRGAQWRVVRDLLQLALAWAERLEDEHQPSND